MARTAVRPVDCELAGWHPVALAGAVGREVLERAGLGAGILDEVVVGCADPVGACGADAARAIVLAAGWPQRVGGWVVERGETSGLTALQAGAAAIRSGQADAVLVVGLGLCSVVPPGAAAIKRAYGAPWGGVAERLSDRGGLLPAPRLSERAARACGLGRSELDAAAGESRRRRRAAGPSPAIVAVAARPGRSTEPGVCRGDPVSRDAIRDWGDPSSLPPAFDEDGLLTSATFAPPADAVSAVLLQRGSDELGPADSKTELRAQPATESQRGSDELGPAEALGILAGVGRAAGDPFDPTGDVAVSVERALADAGLALGDIDAISVVEHDAATVHLVARALGADAACVNRSGGAVDTGNSGAAEELRLVTDGLADPTGSGHRLLMISAGPTGSAAVVWLKHI